MNHQGRNDDNHDAASVISGLSSLESGADDDFDRLMLQNARDERRLQDALHGKVQPFRKARSQPRVGLTLENLERNDARNNVSVDANARVQFKGTPSSPDSARSARSDGRSDPAIQPPAGWGRKGRVRRDWLRTITSEEEQVPGAQESRGQQFAPEDRTPRYVNEADMPRPSIEDSPLSHKSSRHGTPSSTRHRDIMDLDLSFDLHEASMIASTPYIPRNTVLEDIRQRELESVRDQAVASNRLDRIRDSSPEETRRPRPSSSKSSLNQSNGGSAVDQTNTSPSEMRQRRTNSWQSIGKAQAVTGESSEKSPIIVYKKSSETVGAVDRDVHASAQTNSNRPTSRREDSHDLLRRLARASSNTPSPVGNKTSRPLNAPAPQTSGPSQPTADDHDRKRVEPFEPESSKEKEEPKSAEAAVTTSDTQLPQAEPVKTRQDSKDPTDDATKPREVDVNATPMPTERSVMNAKTPIVTGAWVDTPAPRTTRKPEEPRRSPSRSPRKSSPTKKSPTEKPPTKQSAAPVVNEAYAGAPPEPVRPSLPKSALQAIVEEARASRNDYGDSTINSLEELITPFRESVEAGELDEDTLLGLNLPTEPPRNEAERQRQQELVHLHRMNDRLRAARTSIRDASRGMRRVENRVEHFEEINGEKVRVIYRECPCAANGGHKCDYSLKREFVRLFYDSRLKHTRRRGLTYLSIFLISFILFVLIEDEMCERHCHLEYREFMTGYGIRHNAPEFPFITITVFYRTFFKPLFDSIFGVETARARATATARTFATQTTSTILETHTTVDHDFGFLDDEIIFDRRMGD
ncbi:hypothetical protein BS50DRAFT_494075 [Corynespora cassiicola Philippines]|uniref:Uncharacterized protein n=1 Tax=Corynespora cassiicola Philippines TaxID=1448308 RepID=A0A2T2NNY8_CORCC|nr:hypothetical protein BS50DRAFT_494075 [Corynespora cassiicola Philippines]